MPQVLGMMPAELRSEDPTIGITWSYTGDLNDLATEINVRLRYVKLRCVQFLAMVQQRNNQALHSLGGVLE